MAARKRRSRPGAAAPPKEEPETRPARSKLTVDVPADLALELRVICTELPPKVVPGGVSGIMARALAAEISRLRDEHNKGKPFRADTAPRLKPGPAPKPF